jgi:hypothetical protein
MRGLGGCAGEHARIAKGRRCVVCDLFACTSWTRKFRFDILGVDGEVKQAQIGAGNMVNMIFTPLRPCSGRSGLLDVAGLLIAGHAALGGKTVYKPGDENAAERLSSPRLRRSASSTRRTSTSWTSRGCDPTLATDRVAASTIRAQPARGLCGRGYALTDARFVCQAADIAELS